MSIVVGALIAVVVLLSILVAGLLRSHAEMLRAFHQLGIQFGPDGPSTAAGATTSIDPPTRLPHASERVAASTGDGKVYDISGLTPTGGSSAVALLGRQERTLIAFLTSGCSTCRNFWDAFRSGADLPRSVDRLVIVTKGPDEESPGALHALAPSKHTTVMSSAAWDDYGVPVSPYFVLVDGPTGRIEGEGAAATWPQVGSLLARAEVDAEADNEARIDAELKAAGISPDDATLYPTARDE